MDYEIGNQTKVYIAASATKFEIAKRLAMKLREKGFKIVSYWHDVDKSPGYNSAPRAIRDVHGVKHCDLFIELIGDSESRGGRHCELGMALAWEKKVILIGEIDGCIFQNLPWLPRFESIEKFLRTME